MTHFVKIHIPFEILCDVAEEISLRMPLTVNEVKPARRETKFAQYVYSITPSWVHRFRNALADEPMYPSTIFKASQLEVSQCELVN